MRHASGASTGNDHAEWPYDPSGRRSDHPPAVREVEAGRPTAWGVTHLARTCAPGWQKAWVCSSPQMWTSAGHVEVWCAADVPVCRDSTHEPVHEERTPATQALSCRTWSGIQGYLQRLDTGVRQYDRVRAVVGKLRYPTQSFSVGWESSLSRLGSHLSLRYRWGISYPTADVDICRSQNPYRPGVHPRRIGISNLFGTAVSAGQICLQTCRYRQVCGQTCPAFQIYCRALERTHKCIC